jgi:hypothetical protein
MATEAGLGVAAPIHDALLLEAPLDCLADSVAELREIMAAAARIVLDGFEVRTDAELTCWPNRYMDARGAVMWQRVMGLLDELEAKPKFPPIKPAVSAHLNGSFRPPAQYYF